MLGRIWVFITPRTIALRLRGFDLYQRQGVLRISGEKWLFFFIFWREIYEKSVRYPLSFPRSEGRQSDIKGSKNHQKRLQNWYFWAFLGGFSAKGTWVSIFFGIMTYQKHWNNYWNEKKKFWNFCENAYFFWWICLKNLPCAVNGSEIHLNGSGK